VTPLSWIDCISNISFGALLSEVVPSQDSKQPPSQSNSILQQLPATCDSFDAAIASLIRQQQTTNQPKVSNPSLWDAEETCHAFPSRKQTSVRGPLSAPSNSSALASSILGAIPESDADGDQVGAISFALLMFCFADTICVAYHLLFLQQCCTEGRKEEPRPPVPCFGNNENVKPDVSMVQVRASKKR
jgi:hypothetical protein